MAKTIGSFQNAKLVHVVPEVMPEYLKHNDISTGLHGTREEVRLIPDNLTYNKKQSKIRFTLPNDCPYDFYRAYIIFSLTVTSQGSTYVRIANGIWSIIDRIRILSDYVEIENVEEYGRLYNWIYFANREQDADTTIGRIMGVGSQVDRNIWAAGKEYILPLNMAWLKEKVIPFDLIKSMVYLEIYIAQPELFLETDVSNNCDYVLTGCELCVERLNFPNGSYSTMLRSLPALGSHFCTWDVYTTNIDGNRVEFNIPHKSQSLCSIVGVMVNTQQISDTTVNDRFTTWNHNNAQRWQFRLHGKYLPERPVECSSDRPMQAYMNYLKSIGVWNLAGQFADHTTITTEQFITDKFMICLDLETHPQDQGLLNLARDTSTSHSNFLLQVELSGVPVTAQTLYLFIHYHRVWAMDHNGRLQINTS